MLTALHEELVVARAWNFLLRWVRHRICSGQGSLPAATRHRG